MNLWKEIEDIEESIVRLSESQDRILDIFDKNNKMHIEILRQTVELKEEYDGLLERYRMLAEEE